MALFRVVFIGISPLMTHNPASMQTQRRGKGKEIPSPEVEAEAGTYRLEDGSCGIPGIAFRCQVFAVHTARLQLPHQRGLRDRRFGDDKQTGRILVEAVHDARARDQREFRCMVQQCIGERAVPVTAAGMNHEPGGLVDDDDGGVLIHDGERDRLRHEGCRARIGERQDDDALAPIQTPRRFDGAAREGDATGVDPRADAAARMQGQQARQRLVQAQAVARSGDVDDHALRRRSALRAWVIIGGDQRSGY